MASLEGAPGERTEIQYERFFSANLCLAFFNNNDLIFFSTDVEFPELKDGLNGVSGSFGIEKNNSKYFPLKPKRVIDPKSTYKWVYKFEYKEASAQTENDSNINTGRNETETAVAQIWKTF